MGDLGWLDPARYNLGSQLQAAASLNRSSSPIAGRLWSGTPLSDLIAPKVNAAETNMTTYGFYQPPTVNLNQTDSNILQNYNTAATQQTNNNPPAPAPAPTGTRYISEGEALANNWDWNNLPAGYAKAQSGGGNQIVNQIGSAWDSYINSLNQQLGELPNQQANLNDMANSQYTQGVNDLGSQKAMGLADLNTQRRKTEEGQTKTLADLTENLKNMFTTGNVMLGTRGASDSSAANQYSYALTKLGNKSRGDVLGQTRSIMNDINDRETRLNDIVTQETQKLGAARDQAIMQAAQWLYSAQNALRGQIGEAGKNKGLDMASASQNLLNQATQMAMYYQQQFQSQQAALQQWALNNATTIQQAKQNMAGVSSLIAPQVQGQMINGTPTFDARGNLFAPIGIGSSTEDKNKGLFGY